MQQFGGAVKRASGYVTGRFNASSARLNKPQGLDLPLEPPLNAISRCQPETRANRVSRRGWFQVSARNWLQFNAAQEIQPEQKRGNKKL